MENINKRRPTLAPPHPAPSSPHTAIHLYFWGGECRLLPPPGFFGLFLCLSNQLLDEAPRDDREQGRRGRWRGALVLFSNLCMEARREVRVSLWGQGFPQTVCDTWEDPREKAWEKSRRAVRDTRRSRQCGETGWTSVTVEVALEK